MEWKKSFGKAAQQGQAQQQLQQEAEERAQGEGHVGLVAAVVVVDLELRLLQFVDVVVDGSELGLRVGGVEQAPVISAIWRSVAGSASLSTVW